MERERQTFRAQKKKQQIREAAKQLFLKSGFAATSMDDICTCAGVSKQTIYTYYANKEQLLFDVIEHQLFLLSDDAFGDLLERMDFSSPEKAEQSLFQFARKLLSHFMQVDYLKLARMVVAEIIQFPELAALFRDAVPLKGLRNVEKLLRKANESPCVSISNIPVAARSFVGTMITYVFIDGVLSDQDAHNVPTDEQLRNIVHFYMPSILNLK